MPIDCLNHNVPVYDPDEKGCYRWMSIRAGQPSKFCAPVDFEDEICAKTLKVCDYADLGDLKVYGDVSICGDVYDKRRLPKERYLPRAPAFNSDFTMPETYNEETPIIWSFGQLPGQGLAFEPPLTVMDNTTYGLFIKQPGRYQVTWKLSTFQRYQMSYVVRLYSKEGAPPVVGPPPFGAVLQEEFYFNNTTTNLGRDRLNYQTPEFSSLVDVPNTDTYVYLTIEVLADDGPPGGPPGPPYAGLENFVVGGSRIRGELLTTFRIDDFTDNCVRPTEDDCCAEPAGPPAPGGG